MFKVVVRTRDVMATLGLVSWCVHLAFNAEKLITHFVCRERGGGGGGEGEIFGSTFAGYVLLASPEPLPVYRESILWPIIDSILVTF